MSRRCPTVACLSFTFQYKPFMWCRADVRLWHYCYFIFWQKPFLWCRTDSRLRQCLLFYFYLSRRRFRHPIGLFLFLLGFREDYRPTSFFFISAAKFFNTCMRIINYAHVHHVLHLLYLMFNCLRVHSKYSLACPWLLSWPDVDEGDLMDEEYDSEFDA